MLVRSLQSVFNILKGEVSVLEKEYKARCITAQYFLPASSRNGSWGDWRREPTVSTPLNEHIYQFSRDAADYQHLDKPTHTRSGAIYVLACAWESTLHSSRQPCEQVGDACRHFHVGMCVVSFQHERRAKMQAFTSFQALCQGSLNIYYEQIAA